MTKLSDAQLVLLSAAAQRDDGAVCLPERLRGGAAEKVLASLHGKGLIENIGNGDSAGMTVPGEDGKTPYRISQAGLSAVGIGEGGSAGKGQSKGEGAAPPSPPVPIRPLPVPDPFDGSGRGPAEASQQKMSARQGSKLAAVVVLLSRDGGASIDELTTATNWLPHTTRAALTGLRKRGNTVQRAKREDGTTIYRLGTREPADTITGIGQPMHENPGETA